MTERLEKVSFSLERWLEQQNQQKELEEEKIVFADPIFTGFLSPTTNIFKYSEIKLKWPKGIKGDSKEMYMSDEQFKEILGMDK